MRHTKTKAPPRQCAAPNELITPPPPADIDKMKAVILALALSCAGAFAPVNKAAVRAPVELEAKPSVADLSEADLKGKKVLIRCDLNVPIKEGVIGDDTRIRASVPTVKYLLDKGAKVAMCSHLGRPKDGPEDKFSLGPVATRMGEQLGTAVKMAPDCIGARSSSRRRHGRRRGAPPREHALLQGGDQERRKHRREAPGPFDLLSTRRRRHRPTARTPPPRASRSCSRPPSPTSSRRSSSTRDVAHLDRRVRPLAAIVGDGSRCPRSLHTLLESLIKKCVQGHRRRRHDLHLPQGPASKAVGILVAAVSRRPPAP